MRKTLTGLVTIGLVLSLAACGSEEMGVKSNMGATVGISLPTKTSDRWIADGNNMVEQFKSMGYKVDLQYAGDDAKAQAKSVQKMVDDGDKLLVITAVDGSALNEPLAAAAKKKIPVIAYDRLLTGTKDVGYQATFDNVRVGVMQGQLLADKLGLPGATGPFYVELFAGSGTDVNARSFYDGAMSVLKPYIRSRKLRVASGKTDFKLITTDKYSKDLAKKRMAQELKDHYANRPVDAVLSPYDGMTNGIIEALQDDGYGTADKPLPITSGQDAEPASVKSIIAGEQTATIYKDTRELAKVAVQQGNALLTGSKPMVNDTVSYDNGEKVVPTYLLYPVEVDKTNYETLLIKGGYYTKKALGLQG